MAGKKSIKEKVQREKVQKKNVFKTGLGIIVILVLVIFLVQKCRSTDEPVEPSQAPVVAEQPAIEVETTTETPVEPVETELVEEIKTDEPVEPSQAPVVAEQPAIEVERLQQSDSIQVKMIETLAAKIFLVNDRVKAAEDTAKAAMQMTRELEDRIGRYVARPKPDTWFGWGNTAEIIAAKASADSLLQEQKEAWRKSRGQ